MAISLICFAVSGLPAQDSAQERFDSIGMERLYEAFDSMYLDSLVRDSIRRDTLVPTKFKGYDALIYSNSKANLRKTLLASKNPPRRKNLDNWLIFAWAIFISLLLIFFKTNYPLQYRLLSKAWYSNISLNEFFATQTSVFKNSKLLTWFIISQVMSMGVFIVIKSSYSHIRIMDIEINDLALLGLISVGCIILLMANQWLKTVFAYSFYQPALSKDYAIIFRIQSYITSLFLLPLLLLIYYNGAWDMKLASILLMIIFIITIYAASIVKFIFSGLFLQNQTNFILILYLCAFEILPLLVLIKSINNTLV